MEAIRIPPKVVGFGFLGLALFVLAGLVLDELLLAGLIQQFVDRNYTVTMRLIVSLLAGLVMIPAVVRIVTAGEFLLAAVVAGTLCPIADLICRLRMFGPFPVAPPVWIPPWIVWFPVTISLAGFVVMAGVLGLGRRRFAAVEEPPCDDENGTDSSSTLNRNCDSAG